MKQLKIELIQKAKEILFTPFISIAKEFRWSYLPPLMVYLAAGISGLTGIVGIFFVKDYLNLSAAFLAGLGFWTGIPWALKMPLGHLVDLIWNKKNYLVVVGAALISLSLLIMYGLIVHTKYMATFVSVETWFVISSILAPVGYVIQDVVADAMTVEAIPIKNADGQVFSPQIIKSMHTTMQTLGRFSIIGGTVLVSLANVIMFSNIANLSEAEKITIYGNIYLYALIIPFISLSGIMLASYLKNSNNFSANNKTVITKPNWWILGGSLIFVIFTVGIGTSKIKFAQEIIFFGSMTIIIFLMKNLIKEMPLQMKNTVIGTAIAIFAFRAVPNIGPGNGWFEIDILGFDQQFLSLLALISALLTLLGILFFREFMAKNSISKIIIVLSVAGSVLLLPSIGMYYGIHHWTASATNGIVDAKFIAIINTAVESPLGQVSMIPLLAWIAKNAPSHLKATFFAVFASFTNLALSASSLLTKYLNEIFIITREVKDKISNMIVTKQDYSELGILMIVVMIITLIMPLFTVFMIQKSKLKTNE